MQLLTHSRMLSFKVCRQKHWFEYELGMRKSQDAKALRMGSAYHDALEKLACRYSLDAALEVIHKRYDLMPESYDVNEWLYERETLIRLVVGYHWRWEADEWEHLEAERSFQLPLILPNTGARSRTFKLAGKIDGIIRLPDGRLSVLEHKLLSEDLDADSPLWKRLLVDHQISLYVLAARQLGFAVDCVMYNVTRKPTIRPSAVPLLDDQGLKIVIDQQGNRVPNPKGGWRQTPSSEQGYELLTRPMSELEWGEKLSEDIQRRPHFYFHRREIARLDMELDRFREELADIATSIRDAQLHQRWYRTATKDTCAWCSFFGPCTSGWKEGDGIPDDFAILHDIHPELGVTNESTANATAETTDATTADEIPF